MTHEVEVLTGWDGANPFAVYAWSPSGDSGALLASFPTRRQAYRFALAFARKNDMHMHTARILPFKRRARA